MMPSPRKSAAAKQQSDDLPAELQYPSPTSIIETFKNRSYIWLVSTGDIIRRLFPDRELRVGTWWLSDKLAAKGFSTSEIKDFLEDAIREHERADERAEQTYEVPEAAPVKWADRANHPHLEHLSERQFIEKVYADFLGKGMTTGTIQTLDKTLYDRHLDLADHERVPVSKLPNRDAITANRPLPSPERLKAKREKDREGSRARVQKMRARRKAEQAGQSR